MEGALVTLEPLPGGLLVGARSTAPLQAGRWVLTTSGGAYRFGGLMPGSYRVLVQRIGYRSAVVDAELRRPVDANLSVALELEPIALRPVNVEDRALAPFQRTANGPSQTGVARAESERLRQMLFLTPDSRALTYADVQDGVTLGEGDVFRALQRFAGVATRDDYTAELWSRGAPWSHTRVTFDGMPLYNPVHAVGVLSAITPEVLGVVFFHPGVRPASLAGGAAGVVDLRSRPGAGHGELKGVVDLSMASAKLALEQRLHDGRAAWLIAGRRSYFDVFTRGLDWLELGDLDLPYVFHDLTARVDLSLGGGASLEMSGLWEQDRLFGDVENVLERTRARWGNTMGRVTLHAPVGGLLTSHTVGMSHYAARVLEPDAIDTRVPPPWVEPRSENRIDYVRVAGDITPAARDDAPSAAPWSFGYDVAWQQGRYDGPRPRYHPVKPDTVVRMHRAGELRTLAAWAERRSSPAPRLSLHQGLRVETGDVVHRAPALRVAPSFTARYALSAHHSVSFAAGRTWQYQQAIAVAGPSPHPAFHASQFWLWAGDEAPAVRSDILTIGTERWLGDRWLGSVVGYARHANGVGLPDPDSGALLRRPLFVVGENHARGIDFGLRRIGARWSAAFGYSYARSTIETGGLRFDASADRRHTFDALAAIRVTPAVRLAAAYTAMSGAPFTRAWSRTSEADCALFGFGCGTGAGVELPNALRTPAYASLDTSLEWTRSFGRFEVAGYAQIRNLLDRDNATTYSGSVPIVQLLPRREVTFQDRFERGLPRLPLLGMRATF